MCVPEKPQNLTARSISRNILLFALYIYSAVAYCNYSSDCIPFRCDIYNINNENVIIKTLPGELCNTQQLKGLSIDELQANANNSLTYTLCPLAGFDFKGNMASVPGMRTSSRVSKYQQYPDPACALKCTLLTSEY